MLMVQFAPTHPPYILHLYRLMHFIFGQAHSCSMTFKLKLIILNGLNIHGNIRILHQGKRWWMPLGLNVWNGGNINWMPFCHLRFNFFWKKLMGHQMHVDWGLHLAQCSYINIVAIIGCSLHLKHYGWITIQAQGTHNCKHMGTKIGPTTTRHEAWKMRQLL